MTKRTILSFALLLISSITFGQRKNLIYEFTFDKEVGNWPEKTMFSECSAAITSLTAKKGSSVRLTLTKGEGNRTELGTSPNDAPREGWYGFSLKLPLSLENDVAPESIAQWQSFPDQGENWRSAPLFLGLLNGNYILEQRTDSVAISTGGTVQHKRDILGPATKGVWTDFVLHAFWSFKSDGLLELWKDDKLIFTKRGPNCYNDKLFPYFKVGPYNWDFTESKMLSETRVIYADEVRVGNALATYNDVWPGVKLLKTVLHYSDGTVETILPK